MARLHKEVKPLVIIVGICLLKFSSLTVQGQSFGFSLGGEHIPNNGFAPVESIGSTDVDALVCEADRSSCCFNRVGTWLFPNGTKVPEDESTGWLFWTSHGPGVLRLHRSQEVGLGQNVTGLYRCLVPTSQGATVTLHVGVYHIEDASQLTIPDSLQFTLDTDPEIDPPSFTLICSSSRGPVTNVSWTHNGSSVLESWLQASQVESEVDAVYHNSLSVPGRFTGQYQCTVMNNQNGSSVSAALFVQDVPIPEDVLLSQLNESSLRVSWSQASGGATVLHQRIYVDGGGIRRFTDTATNSGSFLLTDLQSEVTYMVSVQSLSSQLPSPVSNPVTKYIVSALLPSSPIITSLNSTSPTSLTLMWELSSEDIIDYFQLSFKYIGPCVGFDHQDIAANHLGSERREYVISGLQEYSQYLVEVTAVNVAGRASGSQLGNTLPGVPGQPTAIRASPTNKSAATVHITWNHILCINQNSEISGYRLQHSRQSSFFPIEYYSYYGEPSFINLSFPNMVSLQELDYILTGLTPTIEYSISVAGVNLNDDVGPYSASAIVRATHPQIFAFMLRGELLPNNSAVALEDIGIDENALLCLANHELRLHGSRVGHWYFPNQTQVDYRFYYYFFENGMYRNRGDGIVLLHRVSGGAEGIYRCEIPNSNWELQSLFVRVYSLHRVIAPSIVGGLHFQLNSKLLSDSPSFALFCLVSNVSAVDTVWRRDGIIIDNGEQYSITKKVVNRVQFRMLHSLIVTGLYGGSYEFSIAEYNKSSVTTREMTVQVPNPPRDVVVKQLGSSSLKVTWPLPSQHHIIVSEYYIYIEARNIRNQVLYVPGSHTQGVIHHLVAGQTYNLTMVALSASLPSRMADILTVTLQQARDVRVRVVNDPSQAILGDSYTLTCTAKLQSGSFLNSNISVHWFDANTFVELSDSYNVTSSVDSDQSHISRWYIDQLHPYHAGFYICSIEVDGILYEKPVDICLQEPGSAISLMVGSNSHNSTHFLAGELSTLVCTLVVRDLSLLPDSVGQLTVLQWYNSSVTSTTIISNNSRTDIHILNGIINNSSCNVTYHSTLVFSAPGPHDSGRYMCRAVLDGTVYEQTTDVLIDFTLVISPSVDGVPLAGQLFYLTCVATVFPEIHGTATIHWIDSMNNLLNTTSNVTDKYLSGHTEFTSVLNFGLVKTSDVGEYTCLIELHQTSENVTKTTNVSVQIPTPNVTITSNETGILYSGTSITITCVIQIHHAVNVPVKVDVKWIKDGQLLNVTFAEEQIKSVWSSSLTVSPLSSRAFKNVVYTCSPVARPKERIGSLKSLIIPSVPVSQSINIAITPIYSPSAPPTNFSVQTVNSRMLALSWGPPPEGKRNGPIVVYYIICCPESSMEDEILSDECVEDEVTNAPVSLTMFIPGTVYNCSVSASTVAGEGPPAELLVQTLQDEELFQLHLSGVGNCSQWLTCDGSIKRDVVSDLVESVIKVNCTITNDCYSDLVFEIIDGGFSCGRDDNDVSFKASLRSKGTTTTSQLLANLQSWIILGKVVNINGVFLKVNQLCPVSVDALGAGMYCESDSLVSMSVCEVNIAVLAGGIVGSFAIATAIFTVIFVIALSVVFKKYRTKRYVISSEDESVEQVKIKAESRDTAETELYEIGDVDATAPEDDYTYISIRARYTPAASVIMKQNSETKELPSDHGSPNGNENPSSNPAVEEGVSSKVTLTSDVKPCEFEDVQYENILPQ